MEYRVILFSSAIKAFEALPPKEKIRIGEALRTLGNSSIDSVQIKKLRLLLHGYRKRVGNYRILFDIENTTVYVHAIKNRKDAYR